MFVYVICIELKGRGLIIHTFFSLLHNADLEIAGYKVMTKTPVDVIKKHVYNINTCWLEMVNNRLPVHVTNALKQQLILMITQYLKSSPNEVIHTFCKYSEVNLIARLLL